MTSKKLRIAVTAAADNTTPKVSRSTFIVIEF